MSMGKPDQPAKSTAPRSDSPIRPAQRRTGENAITRRYLEWWADQRPSRLVEIAEASNLPYTFGPQYLSRPTFLEAEQQRQLEADAIAVLDLLFSLPARLFDGDLRAMGRAVDLVPAQVEAVVRTATDAPVRLGRADFYYDGEHFRLLEFNVSSALGGWDAPELARWLLRDPRLAAFVAAEELACIDTLEGIAQVIRDCCVDRDCPSRPVVALVDWPSSFETFGPTLRFMADCLTKFGLAAVACHAGQVTSRDGHVFVAGQHVDVVYRFIQLSDLLDGPDAPALVEPIIAACEQGKVALVSSFSAGAFASKSSLALLYDDEVHGALAPAERALVDRLLPWTKRLRRGDAFVAGERVDLLQYTLEHQAELVLKPTLLYSGHGIVPGWTVDHQTWESAVRSGLGEGFVVQRRVRPLSERFPADDPESTWQTLNWGVFVTGSHRCGAFVRGMPEGTTIISGSLGARVAAVFSPRCETIDCTAVGD
jgi:hypothetical protein